jgi:hypothetical protein
MDCPRALLGPFLVALVALSPAGPFVYDALYLGEFADATVGELTLDTLQQWNWASAAVLGLMLVTVAFGLWISYSSHAAAAATFARQARAADVAAYASAASWLLLLAPTPSDATTGLGRLLTADLVLMLGVQLHAVGAGRLPASTLAFGPLGAIARTQSAGLLTSPDASTHAALLEVLIMPALSQNADQASGDLFDNGNLREYYAFFQVMGGALVLMLRFTPVVHRERTFASALALVLYAIAVNANVAAGWALVL